MLTGERQRRVNATPHGGGSEAIVKGVRTLIARCDIMRQAASAQAGRADRIAALSVVVTRLIALIAAAGLLVAIAD